ncbi:MAG: hypothetical protein MUE67_00210 [Anaerolineales bacterium]|nr:hypothetical protein [Anaerolineales bacterium]
MAKFFESRLLWGGLLIFGGVLFLLQNLNIIPGFGDLFWAILLGLGGLFFLSVFFTNRQNWWALIPGIILLCVAGLIVLEFFSPQASEVWGGSLILGGIGVSFVIIYLLNPGNWWAIIPAGVMLSLAVITGLENFLAEDLTGGLFLIGLGLTFATVALSLTRGARPAWVWAWIPAGILTLIGLLIVASEGNFSEFVLPVILIAGGGALVLFTLKPRNR